MLPIEILSVTFIVSLEGFTLKPVPRWIVALGVAGRVFGVPESTIQCRPYLIVFHAGEGVFGVKGSFNVVGGPRTSLEPICVPVQVRSQRMLTEDLRGAEPESTEGEWHGHALEGV